LLRIAKGDIEYPVSCEIDPSNLCNHSCVWCINGKFRKNEKVFLPTDKLLDIINQLAEAGVKSVTFTGGGEPLTHPDIILALHYVREKGMEVALVTNGGLLNKEKCDAIVKTCKFVRISLDAGEEDTYVKLHKPRMNTLQSVLNWIAYMRLNSSDLDIGTAFLVHPYNYDEIISAAFLVKEAGASYLQIRPVFMRGMELNDKILTEMRRQVHEVMVKYVDDKFKVYPIIHRFEELSNQDKGYSECLGHNLLGVISANGQMYLFCQLRGLPQYSLGDLYKNTFKEIWSGKQRQEVIKKVNVNRCPPCRYTKYNEILEYLKSEKKHTNFI
jgi:MoaA/NifB/PqqE/SkfB family radical SAM enzyme